MTDHSIGASLTAGWTLSASLLVWQPAAARTLIVPGQPAATTRLATATPVPLRWPDKAPAAVLDLSLDLASLVPAEDGGERFAATVAPARLGDLMVLAASINGTIGTLWVAGGIEGQDYQVTWTALMASGRVLSGNAYVLARATSALAPGASVPPANPLPVLPAAGLLGNPLSAAAAPVPILLGSGLTLAGGVLSALPQGASGPIALPTGAGLVMSNGTLELALDIAGGPASTGSVIAADQAAGAAQTAASAAQTTASAASIAAGTAQAAASAAQGTASSAAAAAATAQSTATAAQTAAATAQQTALQVNTASLPQLVGLPAPSYFYPLSDPDAGTGNVTGINSRAPGTNTLTSYQSGTGCLPGQPSLLRGLPQSTSMLFSRKSSGTLGGGSVLDNTGATPLSHFFVPAPNATRSGSPYWQDVLSKVNTASPYAGYRWGCYWTGSALVLYFRLQSAVAADYIEVRGTFDLLNRRSRFAAVTYDGSKRAAGVSLYYKDDSGNFVLDTMTVASDTFASGDTATNTGGLVIGGMGGSPGVVVGQYWDGWLSSFAPYPVLLSQQTLAGIAAATPTQVYQPTYSGPAQNVIASFDATSDIDDMQALLLLIALQLRKQINLLGIVISGSNVHAAAVFDAILRSRGLVVPIAAYKGADRITTGTWADGAWAAFGLTKTKASYPDPQPSLRSWLAAAPNGSVRYVSMGPMQEEAALLASPADATSPLTGSQLIAAKLDHMVSMCGAYNSATPEYNLANAPAQASAVFAGWPVPIVVSSLDNGTGTSVATAGNSANCPARAGFESWSSYNGYRASSYDVTAAYAAAFPSSPLITTTGGHQNVVMTVNPSTGANSWTPTPGTHSALVVPSAPALLVAMETLLNESSLHILDAWTP